MSYSADERCKRAIWNKARSDPGYDANCWRRDPYGRLIYFLDYGNRTSPFGWELDHYPVPKALGGPDEDWNLRALHANTNASHGGLLAAALAGSGTPRMARSGGKVGSADGRLAEAMSRPRPLLKTPGLAKVGSTSRRMAEAMSGPRPLLKTPALAKVGSASRRMAEAMSGPRPLLKTPGLAKVGSASGRLAEAMSGPRPLLKTSGLAKVGSASGRLAEATSGPRPLLKTSGVGKDGLDRGGP